MKLGESSKSRVLLLYLARRLHYAKLAYKKVGIFDSSYAELHEVWREANNSFFGARRIIAEMERTW